MSKNIRRYNREDAVNYAHQWAFARNPDYYNYDKIGGDCTNFASQCIYAGSGAMNHQKLLGWYYYNANNKSPSWTGVEFLYDFLVRRAESPGPFGTETDISGVLPGDIVQLSFDGVRFSHTPVVVAVGSPASADNVLVAAHTYDCDNKPLGAYTYQQVRFIHIGGVRL